MSLCQLPAGIDCSCVECELKEKTFGGDKNFCMASYKTLLHKTFYKEIQETLFSFSLPFLAFLECSLQCDKGVNSPSELTNLQ